LLPFINESKVRKKWQWCSA